ncbi:LOW QUALITY PROTEIN: GLRA4 isoform 2 [Pan troglodytes]|nr:LOW QUALITY PROTEIN: GLRA4 isoform 2 [Pan troglodytes]
MTTLVPATLSFLLLWTLPGQVLLSRQVAGGQKQQQHLASV